MDTDKLLHSLKKLYPKNAFNSQKEVIEWTTKVKPLLRKLSNQEHYEAFNYYANYISLNFSSDLLTSAYNIMESTLKTAIEELKLKIREEKAILDKYFPANSYLDVQKSISRIIC